MAAVMLFVPGFAATKGSELRFDEEQYAPGDRAIALALVETWPGSRQPEDRFHEVRPIASTEYIFGHGLTRDVAGVHR